MNAPHPPTRAPHGVLQALLALGCLAGCGNFGEAPPAVLTGLIDATEIDVASKVPGRVAAVLVQEGQPVRAGQRLVLLQSDELQAKQAQVQAALQAARSKLALARRGARPEEKEAVRRQVDAAQHQLTLAGKMHERMTALLELKAVPEVRYDDYALKHQLANDQLAMAQARYEIVQQGARGEEIEALEALVQQAEATLAEVQAYLSETVQLAPRSGEVARVMLHEGELAATGYPVLTLVDRQDLWAAFTVREDLLGPLARGATIVAQVPALHRTLALRVTSVSVLGDFATWRATGEKDSYDLRTFLVKARPVAGGDGLRPGMTVRWRLDG